ncbi:hypothetical protein D3C74_452880 [compost metagenome]
MVIKMIECAVQKPAVAGDMGDQLCGFLNVGDVAASAARDSQLPAKLAPFINQQHGGAVLCCGYAGHQPGGAASNDDHIIVAHESSPLYASGFAVFYLC